MTEPRLEGHASVWGQELQEDPPAPGWLQPLKAWQRWTDERKARRRGGGPVSSPHDHRVAEATTLPESGRGQALRAAHRALRDRMRAQRDLRRVLPHLYFVERSLSRQGSLALQEMPVWVLQRGLQQLSRLPADNLGERTQFSVLQQRLVEAIQLRSHLAPARPGPAEATDSFMGGFDGPISQRGPLSTLPSGLEVSEVPRSVFDDLVQGTLPGRDEAANSGWRRD